MYSRSVQQFQRRMPNQQFGAYYAQGAFNQRVSFFFLHMIWLLYIVVVTIVWVNVLISIYRITDDSTSRNNNNNNSKCRSSDITTNNTAILTIWWVFFEKIFIFIFIFILLCSIIFILCVLLQLQQFGNGYDNNGGIGYPNDMVSFTFHKWTPLQSSFWSFFHIFYSLNQRSRCSHGTACSWLKCIIWTIPIRNFWKSVLSRHRKC